MVVNSKEHEKKQECIVKKIVNHKFQGVIDHENLEKGFCGSKSNGSIGTNQKILRGILILILFLFCTLENAIVASENYVDKLDS
jgi:hypothetical protein